MEGRAAYLRVGLLLLLGLAAVIGLVLFLTGNQIRHGVRYETYFRESVQGLDVGAPVKYLGVTLGQVTEIGLVSAAYGRDAPQDLRRAAARQVLVRFIIDPSRLGRVPDAETAIRLGLRVRLATQGLTGLTYLELDFVDPVRFPVEQVPWAPQETYIPSMPSTITQVQVQAEALLDKLNRVDLDKITTSLQTVLDDTHTQLTSGDLHQTLTQATATLLAAQEAIKGADLPALSADLRNTIGGKQTKDMLAATAQAAERLSTAAARLPPLIDALQATIRRADAGTSDLAASLQPILRDAQTTVANLRDTSEALRQYPAQVLLGSPPPHTDPTR
jgi:paraquat-inducible protein B